MRSYKEDYEFGKKSESGILEKINSFFKDNIKQSQYRYNTYDFKGDKKIYELKTRRNRYNAFPDTLLPLKKITANIKITDNIIILFSFSDGLYYIEYEKDLFECFDKINFKCNEREGRIDKEEVYYKIPIYLLNKIN
jgi:hypothetical protein